jgi:predicted HTH transcriptional regulator
MFADRIEILSHGGLPRGMTQEDFFEGISRPRNTTLMRVFLNMGLVEHTGHGIPTIVKKYGKEAFEIKDTFIKCVIPFDSKVVEQCKNSVGINVGINVGLNVKLNDTEKKIIGYLIENEDYTAERLSTELNVTTRTVERNISSLQKKGIIKRIGSKKDGKWIVIQTV